MHPVEEYQDIIALTVDRLNECEIVTPTRRRWTLNCYITQCTGNSISWRQDAIEKARTQQREPSGPRLSSWGSDELEIRCGRENQLPERLGPQPPGWASQEKGKETVMANRVGVNMLQFCSVSNSLSHITLAIKWEVCFFAKDLCRSSLLCRRYDSACMHLHMSIQHTFFYKCHMVYTSQPAKIRWKISFRALE